MADAATACPQYAAAHGFRRGGKRAGLPTAHRPAALPAAPESAGLGCRYRDARNFYAFMARGDAVLMIVRIKDGQPEPLAQGRVKSVMAGSVDTRLMVECRGDELRLSVRGGETLSASDASLKGGQSGLFAIGESMAGTRAAFDNFLLEAARGRRFAARCGRVGARRAARVPGSGSVPAPSASGVRMRRLPGCLFALPFAAASAATPSVPAIATADSDIRPTFAADGTWRLWGTIDAQGRHEVLEQVRRGSDWEAPRRAAFNHGAAPDAGKDFDPALLPDGRRLLFFSDRPGGAGGTDLWAVTRAGVDWTTPQPLSKVNSPADEWSPAPSPDGRWLLFSSDRARPGRAHTLYLAARRADGHWSRPRPVGGLTGNDYAFDPCWIGRAGWIAYSRSPDPGRGSQLWFARLGVDGRLRHARPAPEPFNNSSGWAFGCAWSAHDPDHLYLSTVLGEAPQRLDIHALPLPVLRP